MKKIAASAGAFLLVVIAAVLVGILLGLLAASVMVEDADAHWYAGCKKRACKLHVIEPHKPTLRARGACEAFGYSSRYTRKLTSGLLTNTGNGYYGRYQFDLPSWRGAGGRLSPTSYGWIEQAYRAVVWQVRHGGDPWPNCP